MMGFTPRPVPPLPVRSHGFWIAVTGAIVTVFGFVSQPNVLAVLPAKWAAVVGAVGVILQTFGLTKHTDQSRAQ